MKHFANETSRNLPRTVASQWPQNHRTHRNLTQHLSGSTHTVTKRLFPPSAGNDAVSRNITIVLENLLKDYESSQLPTHGKGNNSLFISFL
jgi:gamma-aminobutyric acid receptor subunit alpha